MSVENPLWGAPRIHGELLKLGFEVAQSSVAKYMVKRRGPPSQGWRTFLRNHAPSIAAMVGRTLSPLRQSVGFRHAQPAVLAEDRKVELLRKRYTLRTDPLAVVAVANYHQGTPRPFVAMSDTWWMRQGFGKQ
jgi:hypothetical protein